MTPQQVVAVSWAGISARECEAVEALLAPDVEVLWPATGELFAGQESVVGVNREYPEGWSIDVRPILADGDQVASDASSSRFRSRHFRRRIVLVRRRRTDLPRDGALGHRQRRLPARVAGAPSLQDSTTMPSWTSTTERPWRERDERHPAREGHRL